MRLLGSFLALLLSTGLVWGEGTYQRTKDDKTMVWNNAPKTGDTASWNGDRDDEGYAKGFGTLTWYTADTGLFASYYGNMIRGKLDGPVNVHSKGKTAHSIFVNGKRATSWKDGRSPSQRLIAKRLESARKRMARTEKATGGESVQPAVEGTSPTQSTVAKSDSPTEAPKAEKEKTEPAAKETTAAAPVTKFNSLPEPAQEATAETASSTSSLASTASSPSSSPGLGSGEYSLEDSPGEGIAENPFGSGPEPLTSSPAKETPRDTTTAKAPPVSPGHTSGPALVGFRDEKNAKTPEPEKKTEAPAKEASLSVEQEKPDNSVQTVMQPPSTLRRTSSEGTELSDQAQLTKDEAINVADTAARAAGYDLKKYERPKSEYNSSSGTWSLIYDNKTSVENPSGEPFSVAVDDKTKKASIVAGL